MSVLQRTIRMFVMAAAAVAGQFSLAEGYHPFSEPMAFNPDWQFFAPVQLQDLTDLTARQRANHGFFVAYDRMQVGVSRSNTEAASHAIDFTYGNRYDFGFMRSNESGWTFSFSDVGGPNHYNQYEQLRLNGYTDTTQNNGGGTTTTLPNPFLNDPTTQDRTYIIQDSLNVASFKSFEANKTWRFEPYRYGGIFEPLIGLRYANFTDQAHNDVYDAFSLVDNTGTVTAVQETLLRDNVYTSNDMLLGQLGFRYTKFVQRFMLSSDVKVFGGTVFQSQETSRLINTTTYPATVTLGDPPSFDGDATGTTYSGRKGNRATVGFDIRTEASFKATKNLDLRGGFAILYIGEGIWRGATVTEGGNQFSGNQSVVMPAFTFGVALNR